MVYFRLCSSVGDLFRNYTLFGGVVPIFISRVWVIFISRVWVAFSFIPFVLYFLLSLLLFIVLFLSFLLLTYSFLLLHSSHFLFSFLLRSSYLILNPHPFPYPNLNTKPNAHHYPHANPEHTGFLNPQVQVTRDTGKGKVSHIGDLKKILLWLGLG